MTSHFSRNPMTIVHDDEIFAYCVTSGGLRWPTPLPTLEGIDESNFDEVITNGLTSLMLRGFVDLTERDRPEFAGEIIRAINSIASGQIRVVTQATNGVGEIDTSRSVSAIHRSEEGWSTEIIMGDGRHFIGSIGADEVLRSLGDALSDVGRHAHSHRRQSGIAFTSPVDTQVSRVVLALPDKISTGLRSNDTGSVEEVESNAELQDALDFLTFGW